MIVSSMSDYKTKSVVLITRPQQDARALELILQERGFTPLLAPIFKISYMSGAEPSLRGVQALIFTSANGVRAFFSRVGVVSLPAFTVGEVTAAVARSNGLIQTESAGGNVGDLADLLMSRCKPELGNLLHIAGSNVTGHLGNILSSAGYQYTREVFYKAIKVPMLDHLCQRTIARGHVDFVLFYSPRTAECFVELAMAAGLNEEFETSVALCLSNAVALKLQKLPWRRIVTASAPNQAALLTALENQKPQ